MTSTPTTAAPSRIPEPQVCSVEARSRWATFSECPLCGGAMAEEHAHYRCGSCGWRDSCCD